MTLEAKGEIVVHIALLEETGIWCPANHPEIYLFCLGKNLLSLVLMILPKKQLYTVLDLKDVFFSLPLAEMS